VKECHAEATAWVVARHFGVDAPYSSDYLLHWGTTPEQLRDELDAIVKAASHTIAAIHAIIGGGEEQHDPSEDV
jgi:hypothetical protein